MPLVRTVIEVRDGAGKPVPEAAVTITKASEPVPEMAYLTDAEGRLSLGLPAGPVTLAVVRGARQATADAHVAEGEGPVQVVLG